ncbi:hypothetical protein BG000_001443 [Podila horticola]|nr:hypothetical protein BG000_001443 [Podila horticola]
MDIHIVIKDDVLRGIVTSMLLAVVGGFIFIIIQSAREGVTFWLYKHFPRNRGKLYVMATSRAGSYLDVLGLFNLLGGFPIFVVLLVMSIGILANMFSGLIVGTKNIPMDLCINGQCFSTGFGQNLLEGHNSTAGINLLLATSIEEGFGSDQSKSEALNHILSNNASDVTRVTYFGAFVYRSWLSIVDLTFRTRSDGHVNQLEFSTVGNIKQVRSADTDELYNATLSNLNDNLRVLGNHSRELQAVYRENHHDISSAFENGDFLSYVATCFTMAVSQTRPIGMVKGYEQAGVVTPVISIKLVLAIPLLLATIAFFIPYAVVTFKLYTNNDKWLPYRLHVDAREYIINLCHSRFIVNQPIGDDEASRVVCEDNGNDGPVFELEKLVM